MFVGGAGCEFLEALFGTVFLLLLELVALALALDGLFVDGFVVYELALEAVELEFFEAFLYFSIASFDTVGGPFFLLEATIVESLPSLSCFLRSNSRASCSLRLRISSFLASMNAIADCFDSAFCVGFWYVF